MAKIILRHLSLNDELEFQKANNAEWGDFPFAHYFETLAGSDFKSYVKLLPTFEKGQNLPEGHVPCSFLFAFNEENKIVGRTSIRHELTEHLLKVGGHIGYAVVPWERQKGYATEILKESLLYTKMLLPKISKILVTCDEDNIGSKKTIEKNQGNLENVINGKMRFWINLF